MDSKKAVSKAAEVLGGKSALARAIGVTPSAVTQWLNGLRPVPPARAALIESVTAKKVTRKDLCPDFPWEDSLCADSTDKA